MREKDSYDVVVIVFAVANGGRSRLLLACDLLLGSTPTTDDVTQTDTARWRRSYVFVVGKN